MRIDLSTQIGQAIDLYRCWEYPLTQLLRALIKPEMIFLDVGANIGYYAVVAASLGSQVYAFEPVPKIYADLEHNTSLNQGLTIKPHRLALSNFTGNVRFYVVEGSNIGLSSLVAWCLEDEKLPFLPKPLTPSAKSTI